MTNTNLSPAEFLKEFQLMFLVFCSSQESIDGVSMSVLLDLMKNRMEEKVSTYTDECPEILMFELVKQIGTIGKHSSNIIIQGRSINRDELSIIGYTLEQFNSWFYELIVSTILNAA